MTSSTTGVAVAFDGTRRLAMGALEDVAVAVHQTVTTGGQGTVLVFDADSSLPLDLDLRGSADEVRERYQGSLNSASNGSSREQNGAVAPDSEGSKSRGPGRPRLGVVAREITLLPRHWDWLATQPGGASVTLRRLVEAARAESVQADAIRQAREATYRFMTAMAGNEPGFEEASRALFAGNSAAFTRHTEAWPDDVRDHARRLVGPTFAMAAEVPETAHPSGEDTGAARAVAVPSAARTATKPPTA